MLRGTSCNCNLCAVCLCADCAGTSGQQPGPHMLQQVEKDLRICSHALGALADEVQRHQSAPQLPFTAEQLYNVQGAQSAAGAAVNFLVLQTKTGTWLNLTLAQSQNISAFSVLTKA